MNLRFHCHTLPNGLTLIGEENPQALSLAVGYFVRTGSRDETPAESGVSHFLEHMLFKGTTRRTGEEVNREFDELGADNNAFTSEESTVYYGAVLPEHQDRLLDLLTDMMRPALDPGEFETEKQVILEEIALYKDRPQYRVFDEARPVFFRGHPLGNSVLGSTESISALTRSQMFDYWARRYAPNNLLLVLTGRFDWDRAVREVERQAGSWTPAETPRNRAPFQPVPTVRLIPDTNSHRAHVALFAPGVSAHSDERIAADILADIIGGGEGSRLHWELVDPGLADVVRLGHEECDDVGAYMGYFSCDPERTQEVLDGCRKVFRVIAEEGPTPDELERSRRKAASALVLHDETPRGRLFHVGFDWLYRGEHRPLDGVIDQYLAVTLDDLRNLLQRRPFEQLTVVGLGPIPALR